MSLRKDAKDALNQYFTDTFSYIRTVKGFINTSSEWIKNREIESKTMTPKKESDKKTKPSNSKPGTAESVMSELETLSASLDQTLLGLKQLDVFLEAVEKLAVTSGRVFEQNQVLVSDGADLGAIKEIIFVTQIICPMLIAFKRNNEVFMSPKLQNLEVMKYHLDLYIKYIKIFRDAFKKSSLEDCSLDKPVIDLREEVTEDDLGKMLSHINILSKIRMDKDFRMVFLFQGEHKTFIKEFNERKPLMLQFLSDLEDCAVQLDDMNKGAKISNVVGSSVSVVGSILSIVGLALTPVTAGTSLALTMTGLGLGVTSGVNSLVTTATEAGVNHAQKNKVNETFKKFMEDVNVVQNSLDHVMYQQLYNVQANPLMLSLKITYQVVSVIWDIYKICNQVSAANTARSTTRGAALSSMSRVAPDLPEVGQAVLKVSPKAVKVAANALFIGMDTFSIVHSSISLYKGSETEFSKWIRAKSALWSSEINSWGKICDSLKKDLLDSEKKQEILRAPFY